MVDPVKGAMTLAPLDVKEPFIKDSFDMIAPDSKHTIICDVWMNEEGQKFITPPWYGPVSRSFPIWRAMAGASGLPVLFSYRLNDEDLDESNSIVITQTMTHAGFKDLYDKLTVPGETPRSEPKPENL